MAKVIPGRMTAQIDGDFVVFLIRMRSGARELACRYRMEGDRPSFETISVGQNGDPGIVNHLFDGRAIAQDRHCQRHHAAVIVRRPKVASFPLLVRQHRAAMAGSGSATA